MFYNKEDFDKALDSEQNRLETLLVGAYTLREFVPSLDGKIYNVRIRRAINELPGLGCGEHSNWGLFYVYSTDIKGYGDHDVCTFPAKILDKETGKRIDGEKMMTELQKEIADKRKELEEVKENKIHGWERYQEMKKIKEYYQSLWGKFCRPAQRGLSYYCKIDCY